MDRINNNIQNFMKIVVLIVGIVFFFNNISSANSYYTIIDLGVLDGYSKSIPLDISNKDENGDENEIIVGYLQSGSSYVGFWWKNDDVGMRKLDTLTAGAYAVNDSGIVVGFEDYCCGYKYDITTQEYEQLTEIEGHGWYTAGDINSSGQITGSTHNPVHAIIWNPEDVYTDIEPIPGYENYYSNSINDDGWIAGNISNSSEYWGFISDGTSEGIELLKPTDGKYEKSSAYDMNNSRQVVGSSFTGSSWYGAEATLWKEEWDSENNKWIFVPENLGFLSEATWSIATGINSNGRIVGFSDSRAFTYDPINGMRDLNEWIDTDLNWFLYRADAINDSGKIVGRGIIDGHEHAFLLIPKGFDVSLDIKPGSCENPLNLKSKGVLPVAILGSEDFDVTQIDTLSITLEGVSPIRSSYEDVSTEGSCSEAEIDGYTDLTLKFKTQDIVDAIGAVEDGDEITLKIEGMLSDGTSFEGEDVVTILKKGKK